MVRVVSYDGPKADICVFGLNPLHVFILRVRAYFSLVHFVRLMRYDHKNNIN